MSGETVRFQSGKYTLALEMQSEDLVVITNRCWWCMCCLKKIHVCRSTANKAKNWP